MQKCLNSSKLQPVVVGLACTLKNLSSCVRSALNQVVSVVIVYEWAQQVTENTSVWTLKFQSKHWFLYVFRKPAEFMSFVCESKGSTV